MREVITSKKLGEEYVKVEHSSGLTLMLYPMKGYTSTYALFGAQIGSIDNNFRQGDETEFTAVPAGIAHYLEHKLFDCEDGDAFAKYAKTGASANAYTSFDRTAYLFSCTDRFEESLRILLDFVSKPYFTDQSVEKERGIIGQEIKMYDDNPDWQVFFNLLGALYQKHPLRIDIAGTVETIADIDADLLYRCYYAFYNLSNMCLAVAGNFEIDTVLRLCDEILTSGTPTPIERAVVDEPEAVGTRRVEVRLPVSTPLFQVGFKCTPTGTIQDFANRVLDEMLLDILAGESTMLYRELYDGGLINATFSSEVLSGRGFCSSIFSGESREPDAVYKRLCDQLQRLQREGIAEEDFRRAQKALYGRYIGMYSRPEGVASLMMSCDFEGAQAYDVLDIVSDATREQLEERLRTAFSAERSALSVVSPSGAEE